MFSKEKIKLIYLAIIIIASVFVFFWNLGGASIENWDEGIYALMSDNIVESGDLNITWNGEVSFWEKPPVGYWLQALSIKIFGLSEFSVRFFPAIFLVLSMLFVFLLAERMFRNPHLSFVSTMVILLTPSLLHQHMARSGDLEAYLLCFTVAALYFLKLAEERPKLLWLSGVMVGLNVMFRGSSGVLVIGVIAGYLILSGGWRKFSLRDYLGYIASIVIIVLPWHIYMLVRFGNEFWQIYFMEHFLSRISVPIQRHSGVWHHYFWYLRMTNGIWIIPCYLGMIYGMVRVFINKNKQWLLLLIWFWVIMSPLIIMSTKLFWYCIILIPPFLYMGVYYIFSIIKKREVFWIWLTNIILIYCWLFVKKVNVFQIGLSRRWYFVIAVIGLSAFMGLFLKIKYKKPFWQKFSILFLVIFLAGFGYKILRLDYQYINDTRKSSIEMLSEKIIELEIKNTEIVADKTLEWFNGWPLPGAQFYIERIGKNTLHYKTEIEKIIEYDYLISDKDLDFKKVIECRELKLYEL